MLVLKQHSSLHVLAQHLQLDRSVNILQLLPPISGKKGVVISEQVLAFLGTSHYQCSLMFEDWAFGCTTNIILAQFP
jgi:hypothetical protein